MTFCPKTFLADFFYSTLPVIFSFQKGKSKFRKHYTSNKDYYQYYNLANQNYKQLKTATQQTILSGEYVAIKGKFSPFAIPLQSSVGFAIKKLGRPLHVVRNCKVMKTYKTLYFKQKIGDLKCQLQLHFHEGKLFLEQIDIQHKTELNHDNRQIIQSLLGSHLEMNCEEGMHHEKVYFEDQEGNSISASCDNFSAQLVFTNPNNESLTQLLATKYNEYANRRKSLKDYQSLIVKST